MDDQLVNQVQSLLGAYDMPTVLEGMRRLNKARRDEASRLVDVDGWQLLPEGERIPPPPTEWRQIGKKIFIRQPENRPSMPEVKGSDQGSYTARPSGPVNCPYCNERTFEQSVCPNCAKGKAGIRRMFVCGDNSGHVFYTE